MKPLHDLRGFDPNGPYSSLMELSELYGEPIWVGWARRMIKGEEKKIPLSINGHDAKSNDPSTWATYDRVKRRHKYVGIMLGRIRDVWLVGIDLDKSRDNPVAREIIARLDSYTETSPSGEGVHVLVLAKVEDVKALGLTGREFGKGGHRGMGVHAIGRYFTVTHDHVNGSRRELRLVSLADLKWLLEVAGPKYRGDDQTRERDKTDSGYGDRFFIAWYRKHKDDDGGPDFDEAVGAIKANKARAGDWARKVDDRQLERSWEHAAEVVEGERTVDEPLQEWDAGNDPGWIEPRQWLLGNIFCISYLTTLLGAGGTGKSALRLLQYVSLATGLKLSGDHVFRRARVLLISLEDLHDELQRRIEALLRHYEIDRKQLKGWLYCCNTRMKMAALKDRARVAGPLERRLRELIERVKPDLVGIDPFVKVHSLKENDSGDMDFVCDLLAKVASDYDNAVDIVHHTHKGLIEPGDPDAGRGSSGIRDAGRINDTLTPMSVKEAQAFGIDPDDRHFYIREDSAKVNIAVHSKTKWYRLISVALGNRNKTYPNGDHVQVAEPWSPPEAQSGLEDVRDEILRAIGEGLGGGEYYTASTTRPARAAWMVMKRFAQDKTDEQCKRAIFEWVKSGDLVEFKYVSPKTRKEVKGLRMGAK